MDAPRDDLTRTFDFELRDTGNGDGLTLEGYGAVFDKETVIDSWEGNFVEKFARGAFKKTIAERTPVVQFDHGRHPLVGSIPIAAPPDLREDPKGLFMSTRVHDNWLTEPVRDAIRSKAIPGMSIRFAIVKESWQDPKKADQLPVRTVEEVKLYELGPVVFPAYTDTTVGVRSAAQSLAADLAADPAFRAELARAIVFGTPQGAAADPTEAATDRTSDETRTSDEAAAGTSDEAAFVEPPEHSTSAYSPTVRPTPSRAGLEADLARVRALAGRS